MRKILSVLVGLVAALMPASALAWGEDGHQIIAAIAHQHLTPEASEQVRKLLGSQRLYDTEVAAWADKIRDDRPETSHWHYADIPLSADSYVRTRDCKDSNCAVDKIDSFRRQLADPAASAAARVEALKFLVHFVADLHQPLHAADNNDHGGNKVSVRYPGRLRPTNLHATWDVLVLDDALAARSSDSDLGPHVLALDATIKPEHVTEWTATVDAAAWANEAHKLAQRIYKELPPKGGILAPKLKADYGASNRAAVELQLKRAGIRLAMLLNLAFAPPGSTAPRPVAMFPPDKKPSLSFSAKRN
ncbi:MAG TPA: S1/P1 nuclease [Longimicrobium sp.]|nr:S1/P1 nuclease [Longimicrobium sp.]